MLIEYQFRRISVQQDHEEQKSQVYQGNWSGDIILSSEKMTHERLISPVCSEGHKQSIYNDRQVYLQAVMAVLQGTWALMRPGSSIISPVSGWNAESYRFLERHKPSMPKFDGISPSFLERQDKHYYHRSIWLLCQGHDLSIKNGKVKLIHKQNNVFIIISRPERSSPILSRIPKISQMRHFIIYLHHSSLSDFVMEITAKMNPISQFFQGQSRVD